MSKARAHFSKVSTVGTVAAEQAGGLLDVALAEVLFFAQRF
jgi:hypothetical protein